MTCSSSTRERAAFGLRVSSSGLAVGDLPVARGPGPRRVRLSRAGAPAPGGRRIDAGYDAAGRLVHTVDAGACGYRFWAAGHGTCAVSADGRRVACSRRPGTDYLLGQVLPFVAVLQGLETLHASAVALGGRCVALAGAPGAGKTAIAVALVAAGATWMTDDVLALEPAADGGLRAHCGPAAARVRRPSGGRAVQRMGAVALEAPLAALYLLRRAGAPTDVAFAPVDDPRALLSASFNFALTDGARLARQLDVAARLALAGAHVLEAPASASATEVAEAVADHAAGVAA